MHKFFAVILFLLLGLISLSIQAQPIKVGPIKQKNLPHECGCSLWISKDYRPTNQIYKPKVVFYSELTDYGIMNLDGKDVRLEFVGESSHTREKVGRRSWQKFKTGEINVRIDFVATKACPARDESCEVTYYDTTITITRGANKTAVKSKGFCGC